MPPLAVLEGFALQTELAPDGYGLDACFALCKSIPTQYIDSPTSTCRTGRPQDLLTVPGSHTGKNGRRLATRLDGLYPAK